MLLPDDRCPVERRRDEMAQFCAYALGDWIECAARAKVPAVPAVEVARFEREDLRRHEYHGPHQERLDAAYAQVAASATPGTMYRWDCCASAELKFAMAEGGGARSGAGATGVLPIDARLLEILADYPRATVRAWRRPWIGARMRVEAGYPREYRAFVTNGTLEGICSYYPQRPLERDDEEIELVAAFTERLIEHAPTPFLWPETLEEKMRARWLMADLDLASGRTPRPRRKGDLDADREHFTADFVATADGLLLLEGGPPHNFGAHPCCFEPGRTSGVRLAADGETLPLPAAAAGGETPAGDREEGGRTGA